MDPDLSAAAWRKSSRSGGHGGQCVEVALRRAITALRDSKNPTGPTLTFRPGAFAAFRDAVKDDRLDSWLDS